jgi:hypothetical protein
MTTDFLPSDLLTLPEAAALVPSARAPRTAKTTLMRWVRDGVRLPDGTRLRLKALRVGAKWCVTRTWLTQFFDALTAARQPGVPLPMPRSPRKRDAAVRRAEKRLEEIGA